MSATSIPNAEMLVAVVDGRPELTTEMSAAPPDLQAYVASTIEDLLAEPNFTEALPAHLPPDEASQARLPLVIERLGNLARR